MDRLVIRGGRRIEGSVQIRGAKNAALPQIAAALLSSERLELGNVPEVTDVDTMLALMREFGVVATRGPGRTLVLDASRSPQRAGALRHGPPHARQHSRAGAAARPLRFCARVHAGRLRDRRAADRPASQGTGGARGRGRHGVRLH